MPRRNRCTLLAGLLLLLLVGCTRTPRTDPTPADAEEKTLAIAMREPSSLDPAFLTGNQDFQVAANLYRTLYRFDPDRGETLPDLVARAETLDDGLRWRFTLTDDGAYADGSPILAEHFLFAWQRILDPATASPGADALTFVAGASEHVAGQPGSIGLAAPDDHILEIQLAAPQPYLPELLSSPRLAPLAPNLLEDPARDLGTTSFAATSGPYTVTRWQPRQTIELAANAHYRGPRPPHFQQLILRLTTSEETALTWWDAGTVDLVIGLVPFARIADLAGTCGDQLVSHPLRSVFYLLVNNRRQTLADPALRQALFAGLQRDLLVNQVLGGDQPPATTFIPPRYKAAGFSPRPCTVPSPTQARNSMAPETVDGLAGTEMLCNASQTLKRIMEFLQQSLEQEVSLHLGLRMLEWGTFLATLRQGDFDLARMSFTGGADPVDFLDNFTTPSSNNFGAYNNPEFDTLVRQIHGIGDRETRTALMHRAHAILCRDLPAIPVYVSTQVSLVRKPLLEHFQPSPEGIILWSHLH